MSAGVTAADLEVLREISPKAAVLTSIKEDLDSDTDTASECEDQIPEPLTCIYDPSAKDMAPSEVKEKCKTIYDQWKRQNTEDSLSLLEQVTHTQAKSQTWHIHRMGRVTGSIFHKVCTSRDVNSSIVKVMRYNNEELNVPAVRWGRDMEEVARNSYKEVMEKEHVGFKLQTSGLVVNREQPHLAASPDGLMTCDCCGAGSLEIKCPYKYREGFEGAETDKSFCLDSKRTIRKSHQYFYQIQLQMYVCDTSFSHFVVWSKPGFILCRVPRDNTFLDELLPRVHTFFMDEVLPELLTRSRDPTIDRDQFCTKCERPYFGKIITCSQCLRRYHYECVHILRSSKNWLCPDCRK